MEEEDEVEVEEDQGTHCEAPHWCIHPQGAEGWRDQPERERLEMQKGECPKGLGVLRQQSVNGSSHKSSKEG